MMMITRDQVLQYKLLWVVGALERLATLGMIENPPLQITSPTIDLYLQLDELRQELFPNEEELRTIIKSLVVSENGNYDSDLIDGIYVLVKDFKNDRARVVKYAYSSR